MNTNTKLIMAFTVLIVVICYLPTMVADYYTFLTRASSFFAAKAYQVAKQLGTEEITLKGNTVVYAGGDEVFVATSCIDFNITLMIALSTLLVCILILSVGKKPIEKWHVGCLFVVIFLTAVIFNIVRMGVCIHLFTQVAEPSNTVWNDLHQTVGVTINAFFVMLWAGLAGLFSLR